MARPQLDADGKITLDFKEENKAGINKTQNLSELQELNSKKQTDSEKKRSESDSISAVVLPRKPGFR